jgi:type IV secretion system protein VirD4
VAAKFHDATVVICCRAALVAGCLSFLYAAIVLCLWLWPLAAVAFAYAAWKQSRIWRGSGFAYGTARLAGVDDLHRCRLIGHNEGLILARAGSAAPPHRGQAIQNLFAAPTEDSEAACRLFLTAFFTARNRSHDDFIRLKHFCHLATFAPPGAGKGVSGVIVNLLAYPGACIVVDPKGENYRLTAGHRQRVFGHQIVRIDPFDIARRHPGWRNAPPPDALNPLDLCSPSSPDLLDWADDMANSLVTRNNELDSHWNDSAELTLATLIAFVLLKAAPHERNLQMVRDLLVDPVAYLGALKLIRQTNHPLAHMLRRRANQMGYYAEREFGSVMTTTGRHTAWLDSDRIAYALGSTSFDPGRLQKDGKMTIYLCLPEDQLDSKAGFLRLMLASLLRCVTRNGPQEDKKVLFILDEAGNIGHMRCLERATTLLRGYGVRLWYFFQSIGQLRETFREKSEVFMDAIDTTQFFGLNGLPTAELVSGRLGDASIAISSRQDGNSGSRSHSYSGSQNDSASWSTSSSTTYSEIARKLLQPSEILQLPPDQTIIFTKGAPPIKGTLVRYYDAPEFRNGRPGLRPRRLWGMLIAATAFLIAGLVVAAHADQWSSEWRSSQQGTWPRPRPARYGVPVFVP